ncbi:Lrp/AsnC ligand binding domain-containing protein [Paeniglutamicibacter gangotriensis]
MVRPDFRHEMLNSARMLQSLPEVQDVFVLGGTPDILIHVICTSVEALRDFVARNLGAKTTFSATQTNLVFEHLSPTA